MYLIIGLIVLAIIIVMLVLYIFITSKYVICKSSKHLVGKIALITGATCGMGLEVAINLAGRGAKLILGCLDENEGFQVKEKIIQVTGNSNIVIRRLDLGSFQSVREFARFVLKTESRLDILINNAGVGDVGNVKSEDGLLLMMQINYYGPFLLTQCLLPLLKSSAPSRIIYVASVAHKFGTVDFDNIGFLKNYESNATFGLFTTAKHYNNSKLCLVLTMLELDRRLKGTGVTVNSLHPGLVNTTMGSKLAFISVLRRIPFFLSYIKTPWQGAQTTIYLAVSPEVENVSGYYFVECKKEELGSRVKDEQRAKRLWDFTEKIVSDPHLESSEMS